MYICLRLVSSPHVARLVARVVARGEEKIHTSPQATQANVLDFYTLCMLNSFTSRNAEI